MPRRKRGTTTEPLRRLAERLDLLRHDAEQALAATAEEPTRVSTRAAKAAAAKEGGAERGIAQRAREASSLFDTGREELLNSLDSQVIRRISALLGRLDVPKRSEVEELQRRVTALENRLAKGGAATRKRAAAPRKKRPS
jgi:hypothetical protein